MNRGRLKIGACDFRVTDAALRANVTVTNQFYWTLKVYSEGLLEDLPVRPCAYSENLLGLCNTRIANLSDIADRKLVWKNCYNEKHDAPEALLEVYSSEDIYDSELQFFVEKNELSLRWEGFTDVDSEAFDGCEKLRLTINTPVRFEGVATIYIPAERALEKLRYFVTEVPLKAPREIGNDVFLFEPRAEPRQLNSISKA